MRVHGAVRVMRRAIRRSAAGALLVGLVALAGCGSSSGGTTSSATQTQAPSSAATGASSPTSSSSAPAAAGAGSALSLAANAEGQLKYDTTSLTAKAGKVSIDFSNTAPLGHNVSIESSSHAVLGATPTFQGGTKTLSLQLRPGVYKFFCSVPGHRMAGMEGTLTVQ